MIIVRVVVKKTGVELELDFVCFFVGTDCKSALSDFV
jgi:hypothetical protein